MRAIVERFVAYVTWVKLLSSVRPAVIRQLATFAERLVSYVELVRLLSSVRPPVYRQMAFSVE